MSAIVVEVASRSASSAEPGTKSIPRDAITWRMDA
jgi:hypothetical protein